MKFQALFLALLSVPAAAFVAPGRVRTSVVSRVESSRAKSGLLSTMIFEFLTSRPSILFHALRLQKLAPIATAPSKFSLSTPSRPSPLTVRF